MGGISRMLRYPASGRAPSAVGRPMSPSVTASAREKATSAFRSLPESLQHRILRGLKRYGPWVDGKAPSAPPAPAGMATGAPDFVGVGVPKAGTTWWFSLIMAHPDIHVEHDKELIFFNRRYFLKVRESGVDESDLEAYRRWFPRPAGKLSGEWTPAYIFLYELPPVLRKVAPEAKVLVLLRDPIERYKSDISRRTTRKKLRIVRLRGMARGFYSAELQPWEAEYDPSEMLVLQFEACLADPGEMLATTFRFLGVDDSFRPPALRAPVNKTKAKREIESDVYDLLVRLYEPDVSALAARYPQIDLSLWKNFTHLAPRPPSEDV